MGRYLLILSLLIFATNCNPLRKAQRKNDDLQKLTDAVNNARPLIINKDSIIFIPGTVRHVTDTLKIPGKDTDSTKYFYVNNYYYTHDSVKTYFADPALQVRLLSLSRDYERNKALYEAETGKSKNYRNLILLLVASYVIALVIIIVLKFK